MYVHGLHTFIPMSGPSLKGDCRFRPPKCRMVDASMLYKMCCYGRGRSAFCKRVFYTETLPAHLVIPETSPSSHDQPGGIQEIPFVGMGVTNR